MKENALISYVAFHLLFFFLGCSQYLRLHFHKGTQVKFEGNLTQMETNLVHKIKIKHRICKQEILVSTNISTS